MKVGWIKSNPILEVPALHDKIMDYLRKRRKTSLETGEINKVLVKNFNMWRQSSEASYMDKQTWENALIDKPDTTSRRVWIGVDVGHSSDLFSISTMAMMDDYWYADSFSFIATKYGLITKEKNARHFLYNLERMGELKSLLLIWCH